MKKIFLLAVAFLTCTISFAQSQERIIKFQIQDRSQLQWLTQMLSIDNVTGNEVIAYTNSAEFERFLTLNIPYEIVEKPVLTPEELNMLDFEAILNSRNDWNYYPAYEAYVSMMQQFAIDYPDLCRLVQFGTGASSQNRKLLACVVSSNVQVREAEPQVFFTSSMHGDELTGYVLMLRYIDYLLSNYGTNERITYLLDNTEIWINPLANPDGTFITGNSSVSGAVRYNANYVDLNRNYKDWNHGNHPDGNSWQTETIAFTNLQAEEAFVLSVNLHGGAEVCNYPWDNVCAPFSADDAWWQMVCKEYADTAKIHSTGTNYMRGNYCGNCYSGGCYPGICHGANWYDITGSRQDYANYYDHTREFCLEISNTKTPTATTLPTFWNYNYRSFLNYTQQALYGIHGMVTDLCSGEPVYAKVFVNSHDADNSFVMTDPRVGYYARPIKGGTYSVTFSAEGYTSQTVSVTVADFQKTVQHITLSPAGMVAVPVADFEADETEILINETVQFKDLSENATAWEWYFEGGTPETSIEQNPAVLYKNPGSFNVKLKAFNGDCSHETEMEDYITVKQITTPPSANFQADKNEIFENETIHFTNLSENAMTWEWFFEGGTPETSIERHPVVLYENAGTFNVALTVTNDFGTDEIFKEAYILVKELAAYELEGVQVKMFPNPVSQESTFTIDADAPIFTIELYNLMGATLKKIQPDAIPYSFSISGIEKGVYFIRVETQKGTCVRKVQVR